jgi:acetyl esterase/lipase
MLKTITLAITCFAAACSIGLAKEEDPLDRIQPVPANEPIPMIDYFRPALFHSPSVNDEGTYFAAIFSDKEDRRNLLVYDLINAKFETIGGSDTLDVSRYQWLGSKHLMVAMIKEKKYTLGTFVVRAENLRSSYQIEQYNALSTVGIPVKDPLRPIIWLRNNAWDKGRDGGLLQIDARRALPDESTGIGFDSGKFPYGTKASVFGSFPTPTDGIPTGYLADNTGELAFAFTTKGGYRYVKDHWEKCPIDLDTIHVIGVSDQPDELIVLAPREKDKPRAVRRMNMVTGDLGEVLYQDTRYDLEKAQLRFHPVTHKLIGLSITRMAPIVIWFDEKYQALQKQIEASLPLKNVSVRIWSSDKAEKNFVVAVGSDRMPDSYFRVDLEKKALVLIKSSSPWIDPQRMRPMSVINYKSRDGFLLEGYLTLPEGSSKEHPSALIVLPHGGPWVRDSWHYDAEVQFLASRGYAVFQPNYRGSINYGWEFPESDIWDFRKMHNDVTDGTKALIKSGLVDRNRIAIMGGSFGGYLALCGATYEPNLYRCAITIAGVFDWEKMMNEVKNDENRRTSYGTFLRRLGDPKKNQDHFDEISPLRHVDQVKIPVFVTHGKDDWIAPASQSKQLVSELEKYHVPHEKLFVGGEGHGFAYCKNRVIVYTAIEAFLAKNLAPLPATTKTTSTTVQPATIAVTP